MNALKKYLGLVWILLGPTIIYFLVSGAITHIDPNGKKEINNPVIWIIIIAIFLPIVIGLIIFGYYSIKGEYSHLPENSQELAD